MIEHLAYTFTSYIDNSKRLMMKPLFFSASNDVISQITDLYDFVWPTASAIWNLRWQVKGFVNEVGVDNVNDQKLLDRFDWGSGIHGVNLRRACLERSWAEQQEQFARFLLINLCALYEGWLDSIQGSLGFSKDLSNQLQFPSSIDKNGKPRGVFNAITEITVRKSSLVQNTFYPTLISHKKNSLANLNHLLICYRYFKECRNCLAHRGGLANQLTQDKYSEFAAIASPINLNVLEVPEHFPAISGTPVKVSLRGVVGFGDIIIKIIATLDAELACCAQSDQELTSRFKEWANHRGKSSVSLKKDPAARCNQIRRLISKLDFPEPVITDDVETLLLHEKILQINY